MNCPVCGGKARVIKSIPDCESVYRVRLCADCKHTWYTEEVENSKVKYMVKFDRHKNRG